MKRILVTGMSGTGKSSICRELIKQKQEAYDIEEIDGLFAMYRKDTGEIYSDYDNADVEKIRNSEWRCDVKKLKKHLQKQKSRVVFYCGAATNMDEIMPLFDTIVLLKTTSNSLHKRLSKREGTNLMGNTEESRQAVLGWKDWWENEMEKKGARVVSADASVREITKRLVTFAR